MNFAGSSPDRWVQDVNKRQIDEEEVEINEDEYVRRTAVLNARYRQVLEINANKGIP